jgi:hypothetical protein
VGPIPSICGIVCHKKFLVETSISFLPPYFDQFGVPLKVFCSFDSLLLQQTLVIMTQSMQTAHILIALLVGYPKNAMDPMLGREAEAVESIKAKKS